MVDTLWPANAVSGSPEFNARMRRQANSAVLPMGNPTRPLGGLSGVRSGTSTTTVTATSTTWTCGPFAGSADVMTASESGPYEFAFDANATGSVTPADASNPRVDIVYVQITDPEDGATAPVATRGYLAGSAAVSPVPPATPARSFVIAQINVPKAGGGSPTVTWVATGVTPGNIQFQTKTQLLLWTTAPESTRAFVINDSTEANNGEYLTDGSTWRLWQKPVTAWSPTVTGVSGITVTASYSVAGGKFFCDVLITLGSSPSVTAVPTISTPVTVNVSGNKHVGMGQFAHGDSAFEAHIIASSGSVSMYPLFSSGSPAYVQRGLTVSSSLPFGFVSGDVMACQFSFIPA